MDNRLDFLEIGQKDNDRQKRTEIYPKFIVDKSKDLMIRGKDFYAIWDDSKKLWTTREYRALQIIDKELREFTDEHSKKLTYSNVYIKRTRDSESGSVDAWHKYCQKQMRDNWSPLDSKIIFADQETKRSDYATKKLSYSLNSDGDISAYQKLFGTLFEPDELQKLEWAVGCILAGDNAKVQKMIAIYGDPGTGKTTYLNLVEMLFDGYYINFKASSLVNDANQFAMEPFKDNPLVAIDEEAKLSTIKDITTLNSLVSHDKVRVNEKYKSTYEQRFQSFIFIATNEPVAINGSKSGMNRRLIDVRPTGITFKPKEYDKLFSKLEFELGAIASHCLEVYKNLGRNYYRGYEAREMKSETDDFYNFVTDELYPVQLELGKVKGIELSAIWRAYKDFCTEMNVRYPIPYKKIKGELNGYFKGFAERKKIGDRYVRNWYYDFDESSIGLGNSRVKDISSGDGSDEFWLKLDNANSDNNIFDKEFADCPAQLGVADQKTGTIRPEFKWVNCKTTLSDIDTSELHYVKVPENVIFIDADEVDPDTGKKSLTENLKLLQKEWNGPPTYAETSKSGEGIHLIYFYAGDVSKLANRIGKKLEVKTSAGNSSMRRKLIKCNDIPIATISGGLPLKEEKPKKVIDEEAVKNEKHLRALVFKALNKKIFPNTKPNVDFIKKVTDEAYDGGIKYDISDLRSAVMAFCANSTNQSDYCLDIFDEIHFASEHDFAEAYEKAEIDSAEDNRVIFDCEVFPNFFLICWKYLGSNHKIVDMVNPTPSEVENLVKHTKLIGFNNRGYDNHILYARMMGYSNRQIFDVSRSIINETNMRQKQTFGEAWDLSYADVYDFCNTKMSLKKWEIELGIFHKENEYPWDKDLPEDKWSEVISYCHNDVNATEAVWNANQQDFAAREVLAELSGLSVNCTTRQHATKIIFGDNKHPKLVYTDLSKEFPGYEFCKTGIDKSRYTGKISKRHQSIYLGEDPSEGGYVYAEPGYYEDVVLDDVESLHPHSIIALNLFGEYTKRFEDILEGRLAVKHYDHEKAKKLLDGKLAPFLGTHEEDDKLSYALKIVINSIYGFTSATFDNPFKDPRNIDNIVAKRGALFMIQLKHKVQEKGFTVAHVKTDSIKIPNATPEILDFCQEEASKYGYHFDNEAVFDKYCLVNDSTYICKVKAGKEGKGKFKSGPGEWSATGAQFQEPYIFKKWFGNSKLKKGDFQFDDFCETKTSIEGALYLDCNEGLPDVTEWERLKEYREDDAKSKKMTNKARQVLEEYKDISDEELDSKIAEGHNYIFIGKVGRFTPVIDGIGGGYLVVKNNKDGKFSAVGGTKRSKGLLPYRWMESSTVETLDLTDKVDISYFEDLAEKARKAIEKYTDFEEFIK